MPIQLRGRGLVEADLVLHLQDADRFQQAQHADAVGIGGIFRRLETDLHMALRGEIVDLVGLGFLHQADQVGGIGQVAIMQEEAHRLVVRVLIEMVHALGVEGGRAALDAMDVIALGQQQFGQKAPSWPVTPVIKAVFGACDVF